MANEAGGTKFAQLITEIDLDRSKYDKGLDEITANSEVAVVKVEKQWKALGIKTDAFWESQRQVAVRNYQKIVEAGTATANELVAAEQAKSNKIEAIAAKQYSAIRSIQEAEAKAKQEFSLQESAIREKQNIENSQYWFARMKYEKEALTQSILEQKKASEAVIALREKENTANQQYWMARIAYDKKMAAESIALRERENAANAQYWMSKMAFEKKAAAESIAARESIQKSVRAQGLMQLEALKMDADRTKQIAEEKQKVQDGYWTTMGVRSNAQIQIQKKQVMDSYNQLKVGAQGHHSELVRLEAAKNKQLEKLNTEMEGAHGKTFASMQRSLLRFYASYYIISQAISALFTPFKAGIDYLAKIETATLGIASSYMTGGKYIDATTEKALDGSAALKAAQKDSAEMIKELQFANLQTIATLDQLIIAYQQTLPVAISKGFDRKQIKDFTLAMVQAAGAIGLPFDQMGEETRSLLTASINPRNSRIATVLGLRNEDIRAAESSAEGLFSFLMDKLKAYSIAGIAAQQTWAGLWSNTKDIINQSLGMATQPLFDKLKSDITAITNSMYTLDEQTKTITWRPEFIAVTEKLKGYVSDTYDWMKRLAASISAIGSVVVPYTGTILEMIITGFLASRLINVVSGFKGLSAALAGATTMMEGLVLASKSFLPILAFFAGYEGAKWVSGLFGKVNPEDLKLSEYTKNQKKMIADREAANIRWEQNDRTRSAKEIEEAEKRTKVLDKIAEHQFKTMVRHQTEFEKEYAKFTMTREENDVRALKVKVGYWKQANVDIIRLEELMQEELRDIKIRAGNERLQWLEELYKATANTKYKDAAIELMKDIKDAEEIKWRDILQNDDDALIIRTSREKAYHDKLEKMIEKTADTEQKAADERVHVIQRYYDQVEEMADSAMRTGANMGAGGISGMPYLPGSQYQPFYDLMSGKTAADQAAFKERMTKIAEASAQAAEDSLQAQREYQEAQREYQEEQKRLWDEQIDNNRKLNESLHDQSMTIQAWLSELKRGSLSPVQSNVEWVAEYSRLKGIANAPATYDDDNVQTGGATSEDKTNFLSYAKEYMEYSKSYGTSGSYKEIYDMIVGDVNSMGGFANLGDLLSGMGLGQTEKDIRAVIKAFTDMGVSTEDLTDYLEAYKLVANGSNGATVSTEAVRLKMEEMTKQGAIAAGSTGGLSDTLQNTDKPFANVQNAINAFTTTGLGSVAEALSALSSKLGISFNPDIGSSAGSAIVSQYTASIAPTISSAWSSMPGGKAGSWAWDYLATGERYYMDAALKPTWASGEWWVPLSNASGVYGWKGVSGGGQFPTPGGLYEGGLTNGLTYAGEGGPSMPEWVVPTYQPQNKSFLKSVGADPETLGAAIGKYIQSSNGGTGDGDAVIHNHIYIDGKEIKYVVTKGLKEDGDLIESVVQIARRNN